MLRNRWSSLQRNHWPTFTGIRSDLRTDVLFVGYHAHGTARWDIQEFGPSHGYVILDNKCYEIAAAVHTISGYSAHADQKKLISFVTRMRYKPDEIYLIHGDSAAKLKLKEQLQLLSDKMAVVIP